MHRGCFAGTFGDACRLLPVHVKPAYHRHQWDLLKLPKNFSDAHINERLS